MEISLGKIVSHSLVQGQDETIKRCLAELPEACLLLSRGRSEPPCYLGQRPLRCSDSWKQAFPPPALGALPSSHYPHVMTQPRSTLILLVVWDLTHSLQQSHDKKDAAQILNQLSMEEITNAVCVKCTASISNVMKCGKFFLSNEQQNKM